MMANYWHIQLHPDEKLDFDKIKEILTIKQVIGMGESWNDKNGKPVNDPNWFKESMEIGDVVMVRDGSNPIALVKITSNAYFEENTNEDLDWFPLRRNIEIIGFYENEVEQLLIKTLKEYGNNHIQAPGTLTYCSGENATNEFIFKWHKLTIYRKLMDNVKLSAERQTQIKALWDKFKGETKQDDKDLNLAEINRLLTDWEKYKIKITNDTLSLDDYTNILGSVTAIMPGGYLCNFLERTTRSVLGSSKPGTAYSFDVKLNNDNLTYYIRKLKKEKALRTEAETYFNDHIKGLLKNIVTENDPIAKIKLIEDSDYSAKQILMKLAVLDNLTDFLYIYSTQWLEELYDDFISGEAEGIFTKNHHICVIAKKLLEVNDQDKGELILLSRFLWRYINAKTIVDVNNPNVILYGYPGTGKTYSVVNSLDFVCQGDNTRYELLQFHPSFSYEDFIEGIKPKGVSKDGNIRFELVNGVFKNFCIKAKNNPNKSFYFVVDEINRANLSSVFGETLSLIEKDYRHNVKNTKNLIRTQYSTLIEDLIKEDKKYEALAYTIDNGEVKFGVPENVYFIGMMNDVDKSIDAFDLALRRRFKWIRKECEYEVIEEKLERFENKEKYIEACRNLNEFISQVDKSSNGLGMGKSYEFGHSFFMKISEISKRKEITQHNIEVLFNLYLRPTLKEYLRAVFEESELDNKLEDALIRFKEALK